MDDIGATSGANGVMAPEIFSFVGAPTGIRASRAEGFRKVAPNKGPMQTRGPTERGP